MTLFVIVMANNIVKRERESNLELLRIITMLGIIAHHFVVNSGVRDLYNYDSPSVSQYFLMVWGMWGKVGINCFILISGYFLCMSRLTWQRFVKLLFQVYTYGILMFIGFAACGTMEFSLSAILSILVSPLKSIGNSFTASFLCFYAFVPFYNKFLASISEREHRNFLIGVIFVMTGCGTFFDARVFLEPLWYAVLYMVAAYIRKYPNKYFDSLSYAIITLVASVILSMLSVVLPLWVKSNMITSIPVVDYYFVADSHKILAFAVGLSAFMVAKNCPKFHNKTINWVAAGTFGVFLIHTRGPVMRKWLWQDIVQVPDLYKGTEGYSAFVPEGVLGIFCVAFIVPILIFVIGTTVDYIRRVFIEKPFMNWLLRRWPEK